jgi:enediyne biosynthesis protein E4
MLMKVLKFLALVLVVIMTIVVVRMKSDAKNPYPEVTTADVTVPEFKEVQFPFSHKHDKEVSLPFLASAIIDIDNDGTEEVFLGGGHNQPDGLFAFRDGEFKDISSGAGLDKPDNDTTLGSVVIDTNNDGYSDLIVSRNSGVYLYTNQKGKFQSTNLNVPIDEKTTALSVAVADINRDGHFDMYVSGYVSVEFVEGQNIFNKEGYGGTSALLLNNGDNTFRNITEEAGIYYKHNTFQGVFIDLDNDNLEDLVVAHDTGQVRTWKNMGNLKFKNMPNPNSEQSSYPMGIAVGDYNNDGRQDLFFSNIGTTPPDFVVRGDLREDQVFNRKWILFRNDGDFKFTDVAKETKLADFEFSWGAIFEDFNLDGLQDLAVSENYVGFPPHKPAFLRLPGRFLLQKPNNTFAAAEKQAGVVNSLFSISPLTADFNNDGYPDLLHVNAHGPTKAFINNGGKNHFLKVKLPDTLASIGAKVQVVTGRGTRYTANFISGEGLCSDQSHVLVFGLGDIETVNSVIVTYLSGEQKITKNPPINTTVRIS